MCSVLFAIGRAIMKGWILKPQKAGQRKFLKEKQKVSSLILLNRKVWSSGLGKEVILLEPCGTHLSSQHSEWQRHRDCKFYFSVRKKLPTNIVNINFPLCIVCRYVPSSGNESLSASLPTTHGVWILPFAFREVWAGRNFRPCLISTGNCLISFQHPGPSRVPLL